MDREQIKQELEIKEVELREKIKQEILADLKKQEPISEPEKQEPNIFVEEFVAANRISQSVIDRLNAGDIEGLAAYKKEVDYLEKSWKMYKATDPKWEIEKPHVARKLDMNNLEFRIFLMQHEGTFKV